MKAFSPEISKGVFMPLETSPRINIRKRLFLHKLAVLWSFFYASPAVAPKREV